MTRLRSHEPCDAFKRNVAERRNMRSLFLVPQKNSGLYLTNKHSDFEQMVFEEEILILDREKLNNFSIFCTCDKFLGNSGLVFLRCKNHDINNFCFSSLRTQKLKWNVYFFNEMNVGKYEINRGSGIFSFFQYLFYSQPA